MIALSSFRPFAECSEETKRNQLRASETWRVFERVHYFNDYEPLLDYDNVQFIPTTGLPKIAMMCAYASQQLGWSCIINADIVLDQRFPEVEQKIKQSGVMAAISLRQDFTPLVDNPRQDIDSLALDFFCAIPSVWRAAALECPDEFRLGQILWDTFLLSFFMQHCRGNVADFSRSKTILHPRHGDRRNQNLKVIPQTPYLPINKNNGWPKKQIT